MEERDWDRRSSFTALPKDQQLKLRQNLAEMCVLMARGTSAQTFTLADKTAGLQEAARWNAIAETVSGEVPRAVFVQRAKLYQKLGRIEDAEAAAKKAGDDTAAWSAADHALEGNELLSQDQYAKALVHYRKALRLDPKLFWAHIGEGACQVGLSRNIDARGSYTAAIAIWPEVAFAYYNRGLVSLQLGDADAALEDLNKAAEITPDNPELYWQRARAYQMKDRPADGLRDLEEAVRLGVAEAKILFLRSELHAQAGDKISAKMDLDAALGHEPTDATDWVIRARARFATDLVSALADLDQALKLEPKSVHALLNKVYVLKRLEKFEECMTTLNQLIELAPENALALAGRGMLYARFQNWDAAKADGKEALIQDAGYQVVYQVAAIYSRLSEHEPVYRARALDLLTVAVKTGVDRTFLLKDPEFRAISDAPEFKRLAKGE